LHACIGPTVGAAPLYNHPKTLVLKY